MAQLCRTVVTFFLRNMNTKRKIPEVEEVSVNNSILGLSRDHKELLFSKSKGRSLNTLEVRIAHAALTGWLNGENSAETIDPEYRNTPDSRDRILTVLQTARTVFERTGRVDVPPPIGKTQTYIHSFGLEALMAKYATLPYLLYSPVLKRWTIGQKTAYRSTPLGEVMAAHAILELVKHEALSRIRQCLCGTWLFARKIDQRACCVAHRVRLYDQDPETIAKRKKKREENANYRSGLIHVRKYAKGK